MTRKKKTKSISGTLKAISKATKKSGESSFKPTRKEKPRQKSLYDKHLESDASKANKPARKSKNQEPAKKQVQAKSIANKATAKKGAAPARKKIAPSSSDVWSKKPKKSPTDNKVKSVKKDSPVKQNVAEPDTDQAIDSNEMNMEEMSGEELFDLFDRGTFKP